MLYLVATPIGNLGDITFRAAEALRSADVIACEDTRRSLALLNHLGIKNPLLPCHKFNERASGEKILALLREEKTVAVITDAGMPVVSDPGNLLVKMLIEAGEPYTVLPGACACVTALAVSGQDTSRWVFEGFLPVNRKQKKERLAELLGEKRTVIFYEAPHKLRTTLDDLVNAFGPERSITLCRELTKIHEEVRLTTFADAIAYYENTPPRGEFVLVVAGAVPQQEAQLTLEEAAERVRQYVADGQKLTQACKTVAAETGHRKSDLYDAVQKD